LTPESLRATEEFGVTEKEMPPTHILEIATEIGFTGGVAYPYPFELLEILEQVRAPAALATGAGRRERAKAVLRRAVAWPVVRLLGGPSPRFSSDAAEFTFLRAARLIYGDFEASGRGGFTVLTKTGRTPRS
jgi:hypothetical protein